MKNTVRATVSLAISAIMLVASVVVFFIRNDSLAWFSANKNISSGSGSIGVKTDVTASLQSFPVTEINGALFTYTDTEERVILPDYDLAEVGFSIYKRALVLVLSFDELVESKNVTFTIHRKENSYYTESTSNFFSNVTTITPAVLESDGVVRKDGTPVSMINENTAIYSAVVDTFIANPNNKFYFIIEYNKYFLSNLVAQFLGEGVGANRVVYENDVYFTI